MLESLTNLEIVSHISTLCTAHHEIQHTAWQNLTLRHPENAKQGHHLKCGSEQLPETVASLCEAQWSCSDHVVMTWNNVLLKNSAHRLLQTILTPSPDESLKSSHGAHGAPLFCCLPGLPQ